MHEFMETIPRRKWKAKIAAEAAEGDGQPVQDGQAPADQPNRTPREITNNQEQKSQSQLVKALWDTGLRGAPLITEPKARHNIDRKVVSKFVSAQTPKQDLPRTTSEIAQAMFDDGMDMQDVWCAIEKQFSLRTAYNLLGSKTGESLPKRSRVAEASGSAASNRTGGSASSSRIGGPGAASSAAGSRPSAASAPAAPAAAVADGALPQAAATFADGLFDS